MITSLGPYGINLASSVVFTFLEQPTWGPLTGVFMVLGITLAVSCSILGALLVYSFWRDHR